MTIRLGLIGGGNICETHARAPMAIPDVEVSAVYGSNSAKVARLCGECGATAYSDFEQFLGHKPMDFVAIGSPSGLHAEQGIAAARRGLHVLTEKPLEITARKGRELIAAASEAGVKLGVFFQDRFKPDIIQVKKWMDAQVLGKPILADARVKWFRPPSYYGDSRWRGTLALDGGGALINQAIHTVDLLLWLLGDVARVYASTRTALHDIEVEDTAVACLEFAGGAIGTLEAATSTFPGFPRRVELTGSEGTVIVEHDRVVSVQLRAPQHPPPAEAGSTNASATSPVVSDVRGHRRVLEDFLCAIRTGARPLCDGREGRRSVELVQALYRSARAGAAVALGAAPGA